MAYYKQIEVFYIPEIIICVMVLGPYKINIIMSGIMYVDLDINSKKYVPEYPTIIYVHVPVA